MKMWIYFLWKDLRDENDTIVDVFPIKTEKYNSEFSHFPLIWNCCRIKNSNLERIKSQWPYTNVPVLWVCECV